MSRRAHAMPFGAARAACAIPAPAAAPLRVAGAERGAGTPLPLLCEPGPEPGQALRDGRRAELRRFGRGRLDRTGCDRAPHAAWLAPSTLRQSLEGPDG